MTMRKLLSIGVLALLFVGCHSNKGTQPQPEAAVDSLKDARVEITQETAVIKFDTIYFDLGSLDINGPDQTRDFIFANIGAKPLVIDSVVSSCPCLDVDYPKDSIAPGCKSKITATMKMKEISSGQFWRSANVYTNGSAEPVEIIMQGIKNYE